MPSESTSGLQRIILDTARQLLTSVGYAQLSMRKIAQKIGYSATSIYLYYANKDELVHALIDEGVDLLFADLYAASKVGETPADHITEMCHAYIRFGLERPEYYEIMYVLHPEYIKRYPADKYRKARRNLELFAAAIEDGAKLDLFESSDATVGANLIWTQLHGVVTLLNSERVDKRIPAETLIHSTCRHIVRSLSKTPQNVEA